MAGRVTTAEQIVDFQRSAVARYLQLATLFRRRIESGEWAVGAQIPTVDDLAAQYGVARATIRHALDQLEREQLIERLRAKGTFVRHSPKSDLWCEVRTDWSGMLLARPGATIEVLHDESGVHIPPVEASIGVSAQSYRHLRRRHWRDGVAFLLADVFVEESWAKRIPAKAFTTKSALKLIADTRGGRIGDARQILTIGAADPETSALLGLALNAPVAHVRRVAMDESKTIVLLADGIYRGDVVRLDMKLK